MSARIPELPDLISDGRWLAHRYDETSDAVQFRFVPRDVQRRLTFLTDQEIGDAPLAVYSRGECLEEVRKQNAPVPRMVFHSAYCCSTLLARAFDVPNIAFGMKEPQILNDVVGLRLRGGDARQVAAATDIALLLLARPLDVGEVNVIKPSNLLNPMMPLIGAMRPDMPALLLHAPLDVFLASIARKEIEGRSWVRDLMWKFIQLGEARRFGFTNEDLYRQTDLQVAAVGWLAQQAMFTDVAATNPRYRSLDSETLIAHPVECLAALQQLFALDLDPDRVASGDAFRTHSKDQSEFSAAQRREDRDRGQAAHSREIGMVMEWTQRLADHAGIAMTLPSSLLERLS